MGFFLRSVTLFFPHKDTCNDLFNYIVVSSCDPLAFFDSIQLLISFWEKKLIKRNDFDDVFWQIFLRLLLRLAKSSIRTIFLLNLFFWINFHRLNSINKMIRLFP